MPVKTVGSCFTTRYDVFSNQLVNEVNISPSVSEGGEDIRSFRDDGSWKALWDTGATCSVITSSVVKKLNLFSYGKMLMHTPSGEAHANIYYVNVLLPNGMGVEKVRVLEGTLTSFDMLIGMDIISLGDFAVTNYNGKTVFSFRMPSVCEIDFINHSYMTPRAVAKTQGRNDLCQCGSGKKYKNCCGKK
jgi:hypothetical protein